MHQFMNDALLATFNAKIAQKSTEADKLGTRIQLPIELLACLIASAKPGIRFQSAWDEATADMMQDARAALLKQDGEADVQAQLRWVALGELDRGLDKSREEGGKEED